MFYFQLKKEFLHNIHDEINMIFFFHNLIEIDIASMVKEEAAGVERFKCRFKGQTGWTSILTKSGTTILVESVEINEV